MDLAEAAGQLAQQAAEIQRELDRHSGQRQAEFARLLATVPPELRAVFAPLAPPQLWVSRHQVHCQLEQCVTRQTPLAVRFASQRYGAAALQPLSQAKTVTIDITVERTSPPGQPPK